MQPLDRWRHRAGQYHRHGRAWRIDRHREYDRWRNLPHPLAFMEIQFNRDPLVELEKALGYGMGLGCDRSLRWATFSHPKRSRLLLHLELPDGQPVPDGFQLGMHKRSQRAHSRSARTPRGRHHEQGHTVDWHQPTNRHLHQWCPVPIGCRHHTFLRRWNHPIGNRGNGLVR